jgi:hypothetical protein
MKKFNEYVQTHDDVLEENIRQLLAIEMFSFDELNEMLELTSKGDMLNEGKLTSFLQNKGITLGKNKGLLSYFKSIGLGVSKLMLAAIKGDTESMKTILRTVKKQEVVDFVLKLDKVTLNVISKSIGLVDAITGWGLWDIIQKTSKVAVLTATKIAKSIEQIKHDISKVITQPKELNKAIKALQRIERSLVVAT